MPDSTITIGLLGMAFKAESDDIRASLSYKFKKALASLAGAVLTTDPFVTTDPELQPLDDVAAQPARAQRLEGGDDDLVEHHRLAARDRGENGTARRTR